MKQETKIKREAAKKAIKYLESNDWSFDDYNLAAKELAEAFGCGHKNLLVDAIRHLFKKTDWGFYSLNDVRKLDGARKVYRNHLTRNNIV